MGVDANYPVLTFETQDEFEKWMEQNHATTPGVWLKFAKKGSGITTINHNISLDVALCYGWIDGQSKSLDETYYLQKFTPRGKKSLWSKINRENVTRLIKLKKMKPTGLLAIEAAKADGRWDAAYDSPKNMEIPSDFLKELKKDKKAYQFFLTLNKTNTYAIAWRLQTAKKPETRMNRMNVLIEMLKEGKKLH
jgi:uncharacterized protein YdeI (YjbR/CyaY-like superfamily)